MILHEGDLISKYYKEKFHIMCKEKFYSNVDTCVNPNVFLAYCIYRGIAVLNFSKN